MDDYGYDVALEYASKSRDRHGVQTGGNCAHCRSAWPCEPFWVAHHAVVRLTKATKPPDSGQTKP